MKKFITIICLFLIAGSAHTVLIPAPDQILLSTSFGTMHTVDSFLVSPSEDGISLYLYDESFKTYKFVQRKYISELEPINSKLIDSVLIIKTVDEKLHFFSVTNLPDLQMLGTIDLQQSFADYTLIGNSLYIAGYYDGILRYTIDDYSQPVFADSSMTGILVTQLSHDSQYLYALDEYNGLLRYELSENSFGTFDNYLFVPLRAFAYTQIDSLFYLHLLSGGLLVGDFNQLLTDGIIDSIAFDKQIENLYYTDSEFIITADRELSTIDRTNYFDIQTYPLTDMNPKGLLHTKDSAVTLALPTIGGGLSFVTIDSTLTYRDGLDFNGKVNDILIHNSQLYLSSNEEAVHSFKIDSSGLTTFDYKIYEDLNFTSQMEHNGDSLFVIYPDIDKLAIIINADNPDSAFWENSLTISPFIERNMYYSNAQIHDNALLFIEYPFSYDIYAVSDSGYITYENNWSFVSDLTSFAIQDSIVVLTNRKNECEVYKIEQDYSRSLITSISLSGIATKSIFHNDNLYLFQEDELYIIDFFDLQNIFIDTTFYLPVDVIDAVIVSDKMFTVGSQGIGKFDLQSPIPTLIEIGGLPGKSIAVDSNIIAIHDNQTVMLYYHDLPQSEPNIIKKKDQFSYLQQNYPNPFNLETVINYTLPHRTDVTIAVYNILGQRIKTLIQTNQDAGRHSVSWDGTNVQGETISSGIYFYRLETEDIVSAKKMMLIK